MRETLAGTGTLVRLGLRRDRWLLPLWILGFALTTGSTATAGANLFPDVGSRIEAANTINATASLVAMFGRVYDPASLGALSLIKYTAFMAAVLAVLMVFVTIRHTRTDEETGRLELLSGGRLGRDAPLAAALLITFGASLALGLGAVVIAVTYALRAVGDLAEPGPSALSWLSPIGWNQQVRAFAGDRWWVLLLPLALCTVLVPVAFSLRAHRDLGAGLREERPGPGRGALAGVWDLAVRLQDRILVAWAVAFVLFGVVIGSLASNATDLLSSPSAQDLIAKLGGAQALNDAFLAAEISIMGILGAAYALAAQVVDRCERVG